MKGELYSIYHMTIKAEDFAEFEALVATIVEAARHEPDTLTYEYVVNAERTEIHILERYRMAGVLPHVEETFAPYAEKFLSLGSIKKLYVYGEPTPVIRAKLDGFGATYFTSFHGFTK
jgi:quinol monooxygenase YgiN